MCLPAGSSCLRNGSVRGRRSPIIVAEVIQQDGRSAASHNNYSLGDPARRESMDQRASDNVCMQSTTVNLRIPITKKADVFRTFLAANRAYLIEAPFQFNANATDLELEFEISQPIQFQLLPIQFNSIGIERNSTLRHYNSMLIQFNSIHFRLPTGCSDNFVQKNYVFRQ